MTGNSESQAFERANNKVPSGLAQCGVQAEFEFQNYLECSGLSRSIGTKKANALCSFNPQIQIVEGSERVVLLGEIDSLD